jgi:NitT/TauT family transport system permease protein
MSYNATTAGMLVPGSNPGAGKDDIDVIGPAPSNWPEHAVRIASIAAAFAAWEFFGRQISPVFMSYPTAIIGAAWRLIASGELPGAALQSILSLIIGFAAGSSVAVALGLIIGKYRYAQATLEWLVTAVYATPQIAWVPLVMLWLGHGDEAKLFIIVTHAFFPVIINTITGVRNVPRHLIDVGRAFDVSERQMFRKIILPSAVPYILAGVRLAVGRSIIGLVVGEFFTAVTGLGAMIVKYGNQYQTAPMFVPIVLLMILGVVLNAAAQRIETMLTPWKSGRAN